MKRIAIFIIVLLAAISTASAYTANFSNGFKIQDDALNNVFMVNKQGDVNFTGRMYGNGSGLTDLPASAVADAWVNASGDVMTGTLNVNNNANISSSGDLNATGQALLARLGIGISKPTYMLHTGNGTDGAAVNLSNIIYINSTSGNILIGPGNTSNALDLTRQGRYMLNITGNMSVNNTLFVNTDGNVGIGTTSPGQKLDVIGSAYVQDIIYLGRRGVEKHLIFRNVYSTLSTDSTAWSIDVRGDVGGANNDLKISRYENSSGTFVDIPIQISQSTGNVGIGTASPTTRMHIIGDLNVSANATIAGGLLIGASDYTKTGSYLLNVSGNASINNTFFVNTNGNVGIGTTSPGYKLEIGALSGSVEPTSLRLMGTVTYGLQMRIGGNSDYSGAVGTRYSAGSTFLASNSYQGTLNTDSWSKGVSTYSSNIVDLGISTDNTGNAFQLLTSPANTGTGTYGNFFTTPLLTVKENGYVGIGDSTPTEAELVVSGTIYSTDGIQPGTNTENCEINDDTTSATGTCALYIGNQQITTEDIDTNTQCDDATCTLIRLDDGTNTNNKLDTSAQAGAGDALYWGSSQIAYTSGTYTGITAGDLSCTNCIGGTEIDETSFGAVSSSASITDAENAAGVVTNLQLRNDNVVEASGDWTAGTSIRMGYTSSNLYNSRIVSWTNPWATYATKLQLQTKQNSNDAVYNTGILIDNVGNVGIGTAGPDSTLHVIGGACIEASDSGCAQSGGLYIIQAGGIGASATASLRVQGSATVSPTINIREARLATTSDGHEWDIGTSYSNVGDFYIIQNMGNGGNNRRLLIDTSGNIEIPVLTASQYVKTDANKKLVSSASFTAAHQYAIEDGSNLSRGDAVCLNNGKISKCFISFATNAVGVYVRENYDFDSLTNTRQKVGYVISIGDSIEWENTNANNGNYTSKQTGFGLKVTKENGNIKTGDLLVTSSTPGHLTKQPDNIVRSYTVAKAMEDVTFDQNGRAEGVYGFLYGG